METETFHGPWTLEVTSIEAGFAQRLLLDGTTNSDGRHSVSVGLTLELDGPTWTLNMEWNDGANSGWQPSDLRREAHYTRDEGLALELGVDDNYPDQRDGDFNDVKMRLVSQDPRVRVPDGPEPYDFGLDAATLAEAQNQHQEHDLFRRTLRDG